MYTNFIKELHQFPVNGFTEKEARYYFASADKEAISNEVNTETISFEDVYPYTGCNPYLLSCVRNKSSKANAGSIVDTHVKAFMCDNLSILEDPRSLSKHVLEEDLHDTLIVRAGVHN